MCNWGDMPPEIKYMIVGKMDYVTRINLKMCSIADKIIVESTPFHIKRLFVHTLQQPDQIECCKVTMSDETERDFLSIQLEEDKVDIQWEAAVRSGTFPTKEEAIKWQEDFYAKILMDEKMKVERFEVYVNVPEIIAQSDKKIKVKEVDISLDSVEETFKWLNALESGIEDLTLFGSRSRVLMEGVGLNRLVINAKKLTIERMNDMNNEQLMNLKCEQFDMWRPTKPCLFEGQPGVRITTAGIRGLMEKVMAGDYPIGSYWKIGGIFDLDTLLIGLNHYFMDSHSRVPHLPINNGKKLIIAWQATGIEITVTAKNAKYEHPFQWAMDEFDCSESELENFDSFVFPPHRDEFYDTD